jgi:hypothetical protein
MTSPSLSSQSAEPGSGQIGMTAAVSIGIGGMVGAGIFSETLRGREASFGARTGAARK